MYKSQFNSNIQKYFNSLLFNNFQLITVHENILQAFKVTNGQLKLITNIAEMKHQLCNCN